MILGIDPGQNRGYALVDETDEQVRIHDTLVQVETLTAAVTRTSVDLRKAHTAAQNVIAETLTELARIRRELREIDADLTPTDPLSALATAEAMAASRRRR